MQRARRFWGWGVEGEGPYTLKVFTRNTDLAGNTLASANNIGNLFGRTEFVDTLSSFDPNDIFKFTLTAQGTITASFPSTGSGTDPDLQLIQDANGNFGTPMSGVVTVLPNS